MQPQVEDILRLSFTAGVTVNEEAGKQDKRCGAEYLRPRSPPPLAARRVSLPSANPTLVIPRHEAKWTLVEAAVMVVGCQVG